MFLLFIVFRPMCQLWMVLGMHPKPKARDRDETALRPAGKGWYSGSAAKSIRLSALTYKYMEKKAEEARQLQHVVIYSWYFATNWGTLVR